MPASEYLLLIISFSYFKLCTTNVYYFISICLYGSIKHFNSNFQVLALVWLLSSYDQVSLTDVIE